MTIQERRMHRQGILNEIGKDWIAKEKVMLVSYGLRPLGMSEKDAKHLAQFTLDDMIDYAINRKSEGLEWKVLFQSIYENARKQ